MSEQSSVLGTSAPQASRDEGAASPLLEPGAAVEKVASGATWAEGPLWLPRRRALRFSDIPGDRILEFSEETGELSIFAEGVEFTNGRTLDLEGRVVECSHGRRAVQRDDSAGPGDVHRPEVLVDRLGPVRLNSPNDVVTAPDGAIWFTDPSYGIRKPEEGHLGDEEYGDRWVLRLDPATGELRPVITDMEAPNGLAFSPDASLLYVADSAGPERGHSIRVYDVIGGDRARYGRPFVEVSPGVPDGIRVDTAGNVWSSSASGVQVFSPDGWPLLGLPVPETVSNLCFGGEDGRTLYMTATTSLYRVRTTAQDAAAR